MNYLKQTAISLFISLTLLLSFSVYSQNISEIKEGLSDRATPAEKLEFMQAQASFLVHLSIEDKAAYWFELGMVEEKNDLLEKAAFSFSQSIDLLEDNGIVSDQLVMSYIERSYITYLQVNDVNEYCPDRKTALSYARQIPDSDIVVRALVQYAFCFQGEKNQFTRGLSLLNEALDIAKDKALPANVNGMIYNASGLLYRSNQLYDKAYEFVQKAYEQWATVDDYEDMFNMQHILVGTAIHRMEYEQAQTHVDILFDLAESQPQFPDFQFFSYYNAGLLAYNMRKYDTSLTMFEEALKLKDTTSELYFVRHTYEFLAINYYRAGNTAKSAELLHTLKTDYDGKRIQANEVKSIDAFISGDHFTAVTSLFDEIDSTNEKRREFVKQASLAASVFYSENISNLDNKVLQQTINIQELKLRAEQDENQIAYLTIILISTVAAAMLLFISYLVRSRKDFIKRSRTDFLTGIANRSYIMEIGQDMLRQSHKAGQPFSVLLFDIDLFKRINDTLGHAVGDEAIKKVVSISQDCLRKDEEVGRIGGEEFLLLLPNTDVEKATVIAERIRVKIAEQVIESSDGSLPLSVSIGVTAAKRGLTLNDMVKRADDALYQAKESGRNKVMTA